MLIGGLEKFSLSDYPGQPCAVIFCQGCNFRCPFCHNGNLMPAKSDIIIPTEEVFAFLDRRKNRLRGVVISGGEATLHPDLAGFISRIKLMGYKVKLDTNGSKPTVLAKLLESQLLDFIAMDIKAPKNNYAKLAGVATNMTDITASIKIINQSQVPHLFRTTWDKSLLSKDNIQEIKAWLPDGSTHITQECRTDHKSH